MTAYKLYDDNAIEEFKKAIYYMLALSNNISYTLDCYAFRPCTKYLYHSLVKEQLNVSSPTQFNDPFDCPILELLNSHGDEISKLLINHARIFPLDTIRFSFTIMKNGLVSAVRGE